MKYYFLRYKIDVLDEEDYFSNWQDYHQYPFLYEHMYKVFDSKQAVKDFILDTKKKFGGKYSFKYQIKARNLYWWTPATKIIHVDIQEKVTEEWTNAEESPTEESELFERIIDVTQTYDFDNGLKYSVSTRTYDSCQHTVVVSLSYIHNGVKKYLNDSNDFDMNLPFVRNFEELIDQFNQHQNAQAKQTLTTRETFLDREMPYLVA